MRITATIFALLVSGMLSTDARAQEARCVQDNDGTEICYGLVGGDLRVDVEGQRGVALYIYDENNDLVGKDEACSRVCGVSFAPPLQGLFNVMIWRGGLGQRYVVTADHRVRRIGSATRQRA